MVCDIFFRYDDEREFRPFIVNCSLFTVGYHVQRISKKACVAEVRVSIKPDDIDLEFFEYTL